MVAMFRKMLEEDRRRAGWSVGQAAWRLGITVREYRQIEAGVRHVASDAQTLPASRPFWHVLPARPRCEYRPES